MTKMDDWQRSQEAKRIDEAERNLALIEDEVTIRTRDRPGGDEDGDRPFGDHSDDELGQEKKSWEQDIIDAQAALEDIDFWEKKERGEDPWD